MIQSRITSKAQTTVPRAVRNALGLDAGDELVWELDGDRVVVSRVAREDAFVNNFSTFTEWSDPLDDVYDNL
jgi:antitoxin PrlF